MAQARIFGMGHEKQIYIYIYIYIRAHIYTYIYTYINTSDFATC
jgi:hypothetical protein